MTAESNPELEKLGSSLQEARLREGLSLEDLAQRLHMGREQLQSLEQADASALPEPVFIVAQARRVACALGVNVDQEIQALREHQGSTRSRQPGPPAAVSTPAAPVHRERKRAASPSAPAAGPGRGVMALGTLVLLGGLAFAGVMAWRRVSPPGPNEAISSNPATGTPATSPPPSADAAGAATTLRVLARQPSWLEVRSSDGTTLFRGTLQGEERFPFSGDLLVLAGRPDLVEVTVPGGDARRLGAIDQVRWERFKAPAP